MIRTDALTPSAVARCLRPLCVRQRASTVLLLLSLLALSSLTLGFNPYADDDETGKGSAPATTTVTCSVGADGVEVCESVARTNIPDEEELAAKVEAAEAERIATMEAKARARAERNAKIDADKAARREARDKERQAKKEKQENKEQEKKHHDLFDKSKLPGAVKKMKVRTRTHAGTHRHQRSPSASLRCADFFSVFFSLSCFFSVFSSAAIVLLSASWFASLCR